MNDLEKMKQQLDRQEAYIEIMNLMGRYQYLHTGGQMDQIGHQLFAYDLPDAHSEYGPLGVFGPEKSLEFFESMSELFTSGTGHCEPGLLEIHQVTTPVIEVAGDLKTAKGLFMSTGAILMLHDAAAEEGHSFTWDTGKYAIDFINVNGTWKIWHLHVCDMWRTGFDEDPVANAGKAEYGTTKQMIDEYEKQAASGETVRPFGLPIPDGPTTFHYSYAADSIAPQEPKAPVPYEHFNETFSY